MNTAVQELMKLAAVEKPFPVCVDRKDVYPGRIGYSLICEKRCVNKPCYSEGRLGEFVCDLGVRYFVGDVAGSTVVIFGLAPLDTMRAKNPLLKGRGFPRAMLESWMQGLVSLVLAFEERSSSGRTSALDAVHDISRMATEVSNLANELIKDDLQPGESIEDAPALHLSILKAAELLTKEFDRLELLFNPASAAAGRMYVHIYQLFHKYVMIANLAQGKRGRRVLMKGRSDKTIKLYESISVLALALVENAVKYGFNSEQVDVEVIDVLGGVAISVRSTGPLIEEEEIPRIFDKGFRGKWAQRLGLAGRGLGLHLAKIVADAHNTRIEVNSRALGYERDGVPVAENTFRVRLTALQ